MVQGYHELYELQRSRLEAQLLQTTAERDSWSQLTYSLALKVTEKILCLFYHITFEYFYSFCYFVFGCYKVFK